MVLHGVADFGTIGRLRENGFASPTGLDVQALETFIFEAVQPVIDALLVTPQEGRNLLGLAPLSFEQNDLAMLTESVRFAIAIALFQSGALLVVECDFQESAHRLIHYHIFVGVLTSIYQPESTMTLFTYKTVVTGFSTLTQKQACFWR